MSTHSKVEQAKQSRLKCAIHCVDGASGEVIVFSNTAKAKVTKCAKEWIQLMGIESEISRHILSQNDEFEGPHTSTGLNVNFNKYGYHTRCYSRFTDISKIERVRRKKNRLESEVTFGSNQDANQPEASSSTTDTASEPVTKATRSSGAGGTFLSAGRNRAVLPSICIICRKERYVLDHLTKKRSKEKLVNCQTISAGCLLQAAEGRKDESLLLHIRDKDLVALEVKYHKTCYRQYTNILNKIKLRKPTEEIDQRPFQKSFKVFASDIIEGRIIKGGEIMRLTKLLKIFVKFVYDIEGLDASNFRTDILKSWIQSYPQLCFLRPAHRNESLIVYSDNVTTANVIEDSMFVRHESDSSASESCDEDLTKTSGFNCYSTRDLYMSAQEVKRAISDHEYKTLKWPPNASSLSLSCAEEMVPTQLYNFLAWVVGVSDEPTVSTKVDVNDNMHRKLLSLSQDIIQLALKGKRTMPKYMSLGMAVRHLSGSAQLIGLLNGLGHCSSHTSVLEHDTALAQQHLDYRGKLPPTIIPDKFITLVWDNIDFREETVTGKGTTHSTNGIAIQRGELGLVPQLPAIAKTKKRTIRQVQTTVQPYYGTKRQGPRPFGSDVKLPETLEIQTKPRLIDFSYHLLKQTLGSNLPVWTGFNSLLTSNIPEVSTVTYLPVINASPTEYDTINTILVESLKIADQVNFQTVVVVMDEATYAKAQQIRWANDVFKRRIVMRLGEFHTTMAYLACIGSRFGEAGLRDVLIEADVVAQGSINGVLNGQHYNRSVRAHKIMMDALSRLRWNAFLETIDEERSEEIENALTELHQKFPSHSFLEHLNSDKFESLYSLYNQFVSDQCRTNPTFAFWSSYLQMVQLLLLFIRSTREGDWLLHLSTIRSLLPWFFAYNRIHYARYLPAYWLEMSDLPKTHPDVHHQLLNGEFVVQRQSRYGFSQVACDQTIEQTCNRDTKTKGGLTGFSLNRGAVDRWILSSHERAAITRECENMAGKFSKTRQKKDLDMSRAFKEEEHTLSVMQTVGSMMNPFEFGRTELVHISSGVVASDDVTKDVLGAYGEGDLSFQQFCTERLQQGNKDMFATMPKKKVKSFATMAKQVKSKQKDREIVLRSDRNLFARLVLIGNSRHVDVREMMKYSLGPVPLSLATCQGTLAKTSKSKMMHFLEGVVGPSVHCVDVPAEAAWVIDGMALLQQLQNPPSTFGVLAKHVLRMLLNLARGNNAKYVHFVSDRYMEKSIKTAEREKRGARDTEIIKIYSDDQSVPKQWKKFLSGGMNKEPLIEYFSQKWSALGNDLGNVSIFVTHGSNCQQISATPTGVVSLDIPELYCNHEEADTRMFLHCAYASRVTNCKHVIIRSPDTDVMVIAVAICNTVCEKLFMSTGVRNKKRIIDITKVSDHLGQDMCDALIGFHVFTGCDSVSSFYGKGKQKSVSVLQSNASFLSAFKALGGSFDVSVDLKKSLQAFVCCLYGQSACMDVNEARLNLFKLNGRSESSMPPNADSLDKHILRANYQAAIHKRSLEQLPEIPSPVGHGWNIVNDQLVIDWMDLPPAPKSILECVQCSCKKSKCLQGSCSCIQNALPCTDLCKCVNCENVSMQQEVSSELDSDDEEN